MLLAGDELRHYWGGYSCVLAEAAARWIAHELGSTPFCRMVECLFPRRRILARYAGADSDLFGRASQEDSMRNVLPGAMGRDAALVAGGRALWNLCAPCPYSVSVWRPGCRDRLDHLDGSFPRNHFSWCRMDAELAESRKGSRAHA